MKEHLLAAATAQVNSTVGGLEGAFMAFLVICGLGGLLGAVGSSGQTSRSRASGGGILLGVAVIVYFVLWATHQ